MRNSDRYTVFLCGLKNKNTHRIDMGMYDFILLMLTEELV